MSVDNLSPLSTLILAGAEGLEPSARGFGGDVENPKSA